MDALQNSSLGVNRNEGNASRIDISCIHSFENVAAYCDTVELFFRFALPPGIRTLDRIQGVRTLTEPCIDQHSKTVGYRVIVHQPKPKAFDVLDRFQASHRGVLCRFDTAADYMFATEAQAEAFAQWLKTHVILKWRRPGQMHDFEGGGVNWIKQSDRTRRSNRDLGVYADRLSKLTGQWCAHLELKMLRASAEPFPSPNQREGSRMRC
jgi:hypothetical protein